MHFRSTFIALAGVLAIAACTKSEQPTSGATSATTATPSAPSTKEATADAAPAPTAADTATAATASASAATSAATAPKASASAAADPACGTKPQPDCPLQAWMKANMNPAVASSDTAALATALDKAATFAPAGYANWASIAKDGAKAAKGGDLTAAKASCRTCHDQYKQKYKTEMRGRKI